MAGTLLILLGFSFGGFSQDSSQDLSVQDAENILLSPTQEYQENPTAATDTRKATSSSQFSEHPLPAWWSTIPFMLLLALLATGPLLFKGLWHHHYPKITLGLALIVVYYYLVHLGDILAPLHSALEYIAFIALLVSLYFVTSGILIRWSGKSGCRSNLIILSVGGVLANFIGTTGATMLLIRPYLKMNKHRIRPFHIVFFIFIVSNVGGALTPIGDPPLFLGFLKGVPFFWTLKHNFLPWLIALTFLLGIFFLLDRRVQAPDAPTDQTQGPADGRFQILGKRNFFYLGAIILSVFIDPHIFQWVPSVPIGDHKFSFIREIIFFSVAISCFVSVDHDLLKENGFSFHPIREVAFIFVAIFFTMMPVLELVQDFANSDAGRTYVTVNSLYWATGIMSAFLDNAPTYVNFLNTAVSSQGGSLVVEDVRAFSRGMGIFTNTEIQLKAISIAAVFFGASTYIGNGPNFMAKSIAENMGVAMPSFSRFITHYSLPYLVPLFVLVWLIFFL